MRSRLEDIEYYYNPEMELRKLKEGEDPDTYIKEIFDKIEDCFNQAFDKLNEHAGKLLGGFTYRMGLGTKQQPKFVDEENGHIDKYHEYGCLLNEKSGNLRDLVTPIFDAYEQMFIAKLRELYTHHAENILAITEFRKDLKEWVKSGKFNPSEIKFTKQVDLTGLSIIIEVVKNEVEVKTEEQVSAKSPPTQLTKGSDSTEFGQQRDIGFRRGATSFKKPSVLSRFFKNHWDKIAIGLLVVAVAAVAVAGVFTFGVVPAIAAAIAVPLGVSAGVGTGIGIAAVAAGGAAVGGLATTIGYGLAKITSNVIGFFKRKKNENVASTQKVEEGNAKEPDEKKKPKFPSTNAQVIRGAPKNLPVPESPKVVQEVVSRGVPEYDQQLQEYKRLIEEKQIEITVKKVEVDIDVAEEFGEVPEQQRQGETKRNKT